jgi:glycosyltransferase involved in cell wall biosynthesis
MRVVFDQGLLAGTYPATTVSFFLEMIRLMADMAPDDEFVLLTKHGKRLKDPMPDNVYLSVPSNFATRFMGSRFLTRIRLPLDVKKLTPDVFVGFDNAALQRYPGRKLQVLIHKSPDSPLLTKASGAALVIKYQKEDVSAGNFRSVPIPYPQAEYRLSWGLKENIKIQYTAGYDYFLFAGDIDQRYQLESLLKAFSLFKQWQQSSMRLVIAGRETATTAAFEAKLDTYKYRADVVLFKNVPFNDLRELVSAAYAFVYPASTETFPVTLLQAMSHGVPVITTDLPVTRDWTAGSAVYIGAEVVNGFFKAMQLLYKDETERDAVIAAQDKLLSDSEPVFARELLEELRRISDQK